MSRRKQRTTREQRATRLPPVARLTDVRPARWLFLPLTLALLLVAFGLLPAARQNPRLLWSFWGAGSALLAWNAGLFVTILRRGRTPALEVVLRKQHYLQACAQGSVLLYWGWYWRQVYDSADLIAAQIVFAYAFDMLLTWSRRDTYTLGFGPFPVIFSINLFLWFKPDWFYLQFLMVAVGFAVKELIRWNKNGRQAHIFNPSSLPLGLFSVILILTGTTHFTWAREIATTQLNPPYIYLLIFLVGLPGQFLFGVASMTLSAVVTVYTCNLLYLAVTGTYLFLEPSIPIAIFLSMHLLFTDPSTSPRTELGRLIFGMFYGLSVVALFALLNRVGAPTFPDKLLAVPVLNVMIQGIDAAARSHLLKRFDPAALGRGLTPQRRNLAYMSVWAVIFMITQFLTGPRVAQARGDVLLTQGRIEEAIAQYRDLVRMEPDQAGDHNKLGFALMPVGRLQDPLSTLRRALKLQPDYPGMHKNLGFALVQVGRPEEAVATFRRALELQPDDPGVHNDLGLALMQEARFQDAVVSFQRALELQPDFPGMHNKLGFALMQVGRPQEAVATLRRALELQPDDPGVHYNLAHAFIAVGQPSEAVSEFRQALRIRPDWPSALEDLAWLQATNADVSVRDPGEAVRLASRAADLSGRHDASILDALAAAYAAAGRFAEATRTAEAAEALAAGSAPDLAAEIRARLSLYRAGQPLLSGR